VSIVNQFCVSLILFKSVVENITLQVYTILFYNPVLVRSWTKVLGCESQLCNRQLQSLESGYEYCVGKIVEGNYCGLYYSTALAPYDTFSF
jgi:hypothetical protein